jgi:predicted TIM-barrel fold metal-dependent hydrolase
VDPRRGEEGLELIERAVLEWGAKGIKLHPSSGWYPNDRELCYPLYELILDLDIPILTHCGPEGGFCPAKYGDVFHWDDVLADFPEMRICLAHAGGSMGEFLGGSLLGPATSLLFFYDNTFMDLSCASLIYASDPVRFYKELRELLTKIGGKIMFGTDSPWMTNRGPGWTEQLEMFRNPKPEYLEKAEVSFNKEELDEVLGLNAIQWLQLDEKES